MSEFFSMGGYALYVWSAYGLTAVTVGLAVWLTLHNRKKTRSALLELTDRMDGK